MVICPVNTILQVELLCLDQMTNKYAEAQQKQIWLCSYKVLFRIQPNSPVALYVTTYNLYISLYFIIVVPQCIIMVTFHHSDLIDLTNYEFIIQTLYKLQYDLWCTYVIVGQRLKIYLTTKTGQKLLVLFRTLQESIRLHYSLRIRLY